MSYCPLIVLILTILSIQSHNLVTTEWNLIKLIVRIYGHDVVTHSKFHQDVLSNRGVIAL